MADDTFERGMKMRRAVLGDDHVNGAEAATTDFDADFQRFITETAWGRVWARQGAGALEPKARHMVTLAILAALGHERELAMHLRATRNTGVTRREVEDLLLHVAVYAGIPAANTAFAIAKQVFGEEGASEE